MCSRILESCRAIGSLPLTIFFPGWLMHGVMPVIDAKA
jgi:hypothetical protein